MKLTKRNLIGVTLAAVGALAVQSSASARVGRIPERPDSTTAPASQLGLVSLGTGDRYFELELFALTRDGRTVGTPMG